MKHLTAKNLKAALPDIFMNTWESGEFIRTKLNGYATLEEAIEKARKWAYEIRKETERAFENDEIDF